MFRPEELRAALHHPSAILRRAGADVLRIWRGREDCDPALWDEIVFQAALADLPRQDRFEAYTLLTSCHSPYPEALVERLQADLCAEADVPYEVPHRAGQCLLFAPSQAQRAAGFRFHVQAFRTGDSTRRTRILTSLRDRDPLFGDRAVFAACSP